MNANVWFFWSHDNCIDISGDIRRCLNIHGISHGISKGTWTFTRLHQTCPTQKVTIAASGTGLGWNAKRRKMGASSILDLPIWTLVPLGKGNGHFMAMGQQNPSLIIPLLSMETSWEARNMNGNVWDRFALPSFWRMDNDMGQLNGQIQRNCLEYIVTWGMPGIQRTFSEPFNYLGEIQEDHLQQTQEMHRSQGH